MTQEINIEAALELVGPFGRFQKYLAFLLWVFVGPFSIALEVNQILLLIVPEHWCSIPELGEHNLTVTEIKTLTIPLETIDRTTRFSRCYSYDVNFTDYLNNIDDIQVNVSWPIKKCQQGWDYEYTTLYSTLVSEWNWVCDNAWKSYFVHTIFWFGSVLGVVFWGFITDWYGRIPVIIACHAIASVAGIATTFVWDFYSLLICRFVMGFVFFTQCIAFLVLVLEFTDKKHRLVMSTGYLAGCYFFFAITPFGGYYMQDWKFFNVATSLPPIAVAVVSYWIPESARWLASTGKEEKAKKILQYIARVNETKISDDYFSTVKLKSEFQPEKSASVIDLLRSPNMRRVFLLTVTIWMICSLCYNGGILYVANVSDNPFVMLGIISGVDFIANLLTGRMAESLGRRSPVIISSLFAAAIYISIIALPKDFEVVGVVAYFGARFALAISYSIMRLYAAEVYPTVVRSQAMSVNQAVGSLGNVICPQVVFLAMFGEYLPLLIFGLTCLCSALMMMSLPETLEKTLPDTIRDGELLASQDPGLCPMALSCRKSAKYYTQGSEL